MFLVKNTPAALLSKPPRGASSSSHPTSNLGAFGPFVQQQSHRLLPQAVHLQLNSIQVSRDSALARHPVLLARKIVHLLRVHQHHILLHGSARTWTAFKVRKNCQMKAFTRRDTLLCEVVDFSLEFS